MAAAVAALLPLASVPGLPAAGQRTRTARADRDGGMLAGLRTPAVVKPAIIFAATTMAAGIFVTFLPLAATHASANVAALALLCQPAASIGGRWLAGRHGDRHGTAGHCTAGLLVPGVLITAAGVAALSLSSVPAAVLAGATLFGVGFGITQNTTLTQMYGRVPESGYSMVSAVWNLAYDAGMGIGAAGFGLLAAHAGYPAAFVLTAIMLPIPLLLVGIPDGLLRHP